MHLRIAALSAALLVVGCAFASPPVRERADALRQVRFGPTDRFTPADLADGTPADAGAAVLATARRMIKRGTVIVGSCWDYANEVYIRAGFPLRRGARKTVFKGSRKRKRFANVDLIRPGDWLYYVNHSYHDVQHSAIFVRWIDRGARIALMITYRGAKRRVPGVYDEYDLSSVYRIIRPTG